MFIVLVFCENIIFKKDSLRNKFMGFIINELITCILVTKHMKSNVSIPVLLSNVMQSNKQKNILEDQVTVLKKNSQTAAPVKDTLFSKIQKCFYVMACAREIKQNLFLSYNQVKCLSRGLKNSFRSEET